MQTSAEPLPADQVLEVVRAAIAIVLERDAETIVAETTFEALAADSLALVVMAEIIEERLASVAPPGFRLGDRELAELHAVRDAVDLVLESL